MLPESGAERTTALARLDALVAQVRAADPGADVVVAGVGDGVSEVRPRAILAAGPTYGRGLLDLGVDAPAGGRAAAGPHRDGADPGRGVRRRGHRAPADGVARTTAAAASLVAGRVGFETRAATLRALSPQVTLWLAVGYALWAAVVALLWWRRGPRPDGPCPRGCGRPGSPWRWRPCRPSSSTSCRGGARARRVAAVPRRSSRSWSRCSPRLRSGRAAADRSGRCASSPS